jgi:hypothetical protein
MSRIYTGDVPCAGCGKSGKENRRPSRDSICYQCMDDLKTYQKILERNKGNKDAYVNFSVIDHKIWYLSGDDYGDLIAALRQLFTALDTPNADRHSIDVPEIKHGTYYSSSFSIFRHYEYTYNGMTHYGEGAFVIREDIALILDSLLSALENYSTTVYAEGKKDGGNLLKRLGKHEITPDEFAERIKGGRY